MTKRRISINLGVGRPTLFPNEAKKRVLVSIRPELAQKFVELGQGNLSHGIELAIEQADVNALKENDFPDADPKRGKFNLTLRPSTMKTLKDIGRGKASRGADVLAEAVRRKLIR